MKTRANMDNKQFLEFIKNAEVINAGSEAHLKMHELSARAQKITMRLNYGFGGKQVRNPKRRSVLVGKKPFARSSMLPEHKQPLAGKLARVLAAEFLPHGYCKVARLLRSHRSAVILQRNPRLVYHY